MEENDIKPGFFFQHFRENSTAKKTQFLPYLKKLKAIFGPKLKVGAAFFQTLKTQIFVKKTQNMGGKLRIFPQLNTGAASGC